MKIWVFSIGEPTTELCCELLRKYGFEVILLQDNTSLWDKLKRFYTEALASKDGRVMRIDADIIPYEAVKDMNFTELASWTCASGLDWYKQGEGAISIHLMSRKAIELCLANIDSAKDKNRPESHLWRLQDINKLTGINKQHIYGIHGYGQQEHRERIKELKLSRGQVYNWELVEQMEKLK